ncbi:MAG: mltG [Thermoleophilia bacterium]|nr:mltG [Thermoleophilia bacterium]
MRLFGRGDRPQAMEWGSSFAEAAAPTRSRRRGRFGTDTYDARVTSPRNGDQQQRAIGTRRIDAPHPEAFGSAPPPRRKRGIGQRLLSLVLLIAAVVLIGGLGWIALSFTGVGGGSEVKAGTPVKVVIPQGSSAVDVADILAKANVVDRETVFRARLKLNGDGAAFKSGTYNMKTGSSYDTIVKVLEKGPAAAPTFDITIVEGQRMEETAAAIDASRAEAGTSGGKVLPAFTGAEYLKAVKAQPIPAYLKVPKDRLSLAGVREGLQFPATYQLKHAATAEDFVAKQREAFDGVMQELDLTAAAKANLTPYDVVIIASLIEREARLPKERPRVAAVIWNRLKGGEPLGIDASNQYSVYEPGSKEFWESELKQSQLELDSPYNLRKVGGLPPTPIAAPSRASLEAAAAPNPADITNDIRYYVANPDGSGEHFFTASYDEFLNHPFQGG